MKVARPTSSTCLLAIAAGMIGLCISSSAQAQNAAAAFGGYIAAYLVQNGETFYASTAGCKTPEGEGGRSAGHQCGAGCLSAQPHTGRSTAFSEMA